MLREILSGQMDTVAWVQFLLLIPIILFSLSVHESAHAYVAHKLGDDTARNFGRITLNPAKHFDPVGFLFLLLFGFGWAKPVPVNTRNMKNGRWGFVATSIAGPLSNILLAFISAILAELTLVVLTHIPNMGGISGMLTYSFFQMAVSLNVGYAVFNLLPIPPLDGSRLWTALLPRKIAEWTFRYERYMQYALLIFLCLGAFTDVINNITSTVTYGILRLVDYIPFYLLYGAAA
mgnify:FL=1